MNSRIFNTLFVFSLLSAIAPVHAISQKQSNKIKRCAWHTVKIIGSGASLYYRIYWDTAGFFNLDHPHKPIKPIWSSNPDYKKGFDTLYERYLGKTEYIITQPCMLAVEIAAFKSGIDGLREEFGYKSKK